MPGECLLQIAFSNQTPLKRSMIKTICNDSQNRFFLEVGMQLQVQCILIFYCEAFPRFLFNSFKFKTTFFSFSNFFIQAHHEHSFGAEHKHAWVFCNKNHNILQILWWELMEENCILNIKYQNEWIDSWPKKLEKSKFFTFW